MKLENKVALITGGSRGIGYAIAKTYLENGAKVIVCGSKKETADKAVASLKALNENYVVEGAYPNLTDYNSVLETVQNVIAKYGKIDILVNNAGVSAMKSIYNTKPEEFDKVMALNVNAVYYAIHATVPYMKQNGGGVIINTSSMVSIYGQPAGAEYPTSKFAVNGLTKSLAKYKKALATSSGVPIRPSGIVFLIPSRICSGKEATISVSVTPGATAFTRI